MTTARSYLLALTATAVLCLGCDVGDVDHDLNEVANQTDELRLEIVGADTGAAEADGRDELLHVIDTTSFGGEGLPGRIWGPCVSGPPSEPYWDCVGDNTGLGLACLRPVSDDGLNICAPQTADPFVEADCGNVQPPDYADLGVRTNGSAYCVIDCESDADCGDGQRCSPTSRFCAWAG